MCDMQKMPTREDASCEDGSEMNFTAFSAVGGAGTHFVTTGGQLPVAKLQQNVSNNGTSLSQVVSMVGGVSLPEGMQYVRTLDGGAALQNAPQLISVPIALPGVKPGDPQPTVQIQVLNPNLTLQTQQQPKYQMQIPIQGFQQGGAVLTVAYSPETNENGAIQLLGNSLPEGTMRMRSGLQVLAALPQDMQLMQSAQGKDQMGQNVQHQVFVTQDHQIVITNPGENKPLNNNTSGDNNNTVEIVIKEECDETMNDDESSQGTETSEGVSWQLANNSQDLVKYMNTLPLQEKQVLPVSLQQFLKLNPNQETKKDYTEMEMNAATELKDRTVAEAVLDDDGVIIIKKKKKYKKKTKPARPKPGQVVITTTSDGTLIYCCPECQMAYPAKEQLEMHLVVHKIERRFICGLCGAGLKRKEHLERHKLGHNPERPYVCGVCRKGFKRREHLNLHTVIHSGVKTEMCGECGKGFYRKDHLRKHARSHETKRARDGSNSDRVNVKREVGSPPAAAAPSTASPDNNILPEITIHVPTSANMQMPIQINIPQHMVTSLAAAQAQSAQQALNDAHCQLDALLAEHS